MVWILVFYTWQEKLCPRRQRWSILTLSCLVFVASVEKIVSLRAHLSWVIYVTWRHWIEYLNWLIHYTALKSGPFWSWVSRCFPLATKKNEKRIIFSKSNIHAMWMCIANMHWNLFRWRNSIPHSISLSQTDSNLSVCLTVTLRNSNSFVSLSLSDQLFLIF